MLDSPWFFFLGDIRKVLRKEVLFGLVLLGFLLVAYPALGGYNGVLGELFFHHLPSARAEAMGRGYVAIDGDLFANFYNPAGLASARGALVTGSYLPSPLLLLKKSSLSFIGGGFQIGDYGVVALSRCHLSFGRRLLWNFDHQRIEEFTPGVSMYALTMATDLESFLFGVNLKLIHRRYGFDDNTNTGLMDLGILRNFSLQEGGKIQQVATVGVSLFNFTYSSIGPSGNEDELPVIFRLGGSYRISLFGCSVLENLETFDALCHIEYQKLLNSKYEKGIKMGGEFTLLELLIVRYGYYRRRIDDLGHPQANKSLLSGNTYGFGVRIPLSQLSGSKIPLDLRFDMVRLPQPSYVKTGTTEGKFSQYTLNLITQATKEITCHCERNENLKIPNTCLELWIASSLCSSQ